MTPKRTLLTESLNAAETVCQLQTKLCLLILIQQPSFGGFLPRVTSRTRARALHSLCRYEPDSCRRLDLRQVDCRLAALSLVCDGLCVDQVGGGADGQLLLQSSSNVAPACQHKRIVRVWLQLRDQLSLLFPLHLHAPLVIQDL